MPITITTNFTGSPDERERRAAILLIDQENERRAAQDPPGTPLPKSNGGEIKASFLTILDAFAANWLQSYIKQAEDIEFREKRDWRTQFEQASDNQRDAAWIALGGTP